ncbi:hypothetical protein EK904_008632 [Melospiza melodia maxima]|nr:hypothetical protein EK904_008632 [Melospiza melodia maxima]
MGKKAANLTRVIVGCVLGDILARIPFETGFDCISQGREARAVQGDLEQPSSLQCKWTWILTSPGLQAVAGGIKKPWEKVL